MIPRVLENYTSTPLYRMTPAGGDFPLTYYTWSRESNEVQEIVNILMAEERGSDIEDPNVWEIDIQRGIGSVSHPTTPSAAVSQVQPEAGRHSPRYRIHTYDYNSYSDDSCDDELDIDPAARQLRYNQPISRPNTLHRDSRPNQINRYSSLQCG